MKLKIKSTQTWFFLVALFVLIVIILGLHFFWFGRFYGLTRCLKKQEATLYGAYWCPHCQREKDLFGPSAKYLPYVECATRDNWKQRPFCANYNISKYPTWLFKDGSRLTGDVSPEQLSAKTGCRLSW